MESARSGWRVIPSFSATWRSRRSSRDSPSSRTSEPDSCWKRQITGNLEHPGIVPVYSLGKNAGGRPFYAMRFIRGESLAVANRRFHHDFREQTGSATAGSRRPSQWGIEFRQLVGRFLDVCDAIDYAHSRGVLHRDLKPANIMLGAYGETLVVDWGLAKVLGKDDIVSQSPNREAATIAADESGALSSRTEQGTTIGTPAYMSPEQAGGQIDQLGPASDVYSLGASMYELLTGQLAFGDGKIAETITKVLAGDFPPPRAVDRSIPAPLESICLKAMANDPPARYGSVRALAQDLEHWLADEPVAAHPERWLERLSGGGSANTATGPWRGRPRSWASRWPPASPSRSSRERDAARRLARKEAETNFNMAQQAVEVYLTNVSENTLLNQQDSVDIRALRRELLNSALEYYKEFVAQRKNDPLLRRQLANAYFRVGQLTNEIGSRCRWRSMRLARHRPSGSHSSMPTPTTTSWKAVSPTATWRSAESSRPAATTPRPCTRSLSRERSSNDWPSAAHPTRV